MSYEQSNVGLGMVPCKPSCQCDDCTMDRMQNRNLVLQNRIAELERKLGEARALGRWEPLLEALWVATKGVHPETGEAWLTPRMEREAN